MHRLGHNAEGASVHVFADLRRALLAVELRENVEKAFALQLPLILFLFGKIVL
jgi:hypothetical protein